MWTAIISGLLALGGAIISGIQGKKNVESTNETNLAITQDTNDSNKQLADLEFSHNKELAEYQYSKNLEMWNLQNEYNSPTSQMKRLKDAGLNPAMMYGNGSAASVGNASSAPTYEMAKYQAPRMIPATMRAYEWQSVIAPAIQAYQQIQMNSAQLDLVNEQKKNVAQRTLTDGIRSAGIQANTAKTHFSLGIAKKLEENTLQVAQANLQNILKDMDLKSTRIDDMISQMDYRQYQKKDLQTTLDMRKFGVERTDPMIFRFISKLLNSFGFKGF